MAGLKSKDSIEITITQELKLFIKSITASYIFIFYQEKYDFARRIDMLELLEKEDVTRFAARVEKARLQR